MSDAWKYKFNSYKLTCHQSKNKIKSFIYSLIRSLKFINHSHISYCEHLVVPLTFFFFIIIRPPKYEINGNLTQIETLNRFLKNVTNMLDHQWCLISHNSLRLLFLQTSLLQNYTSNNIYSLLKKRYKIKD